MEPIIILCTCKEEDAEKIVNELLTKKLIACVNSFPVKSFFWWKGKMEKEEEILLMMKSSEEKWDAIQKEIKKIHSYEVPEIISISIKNCLPDYLKWMESVVK